MEAIQWPENATARSELNENEIAVIEKAARYEFFEDSQKITQVAVGENMPEDFASKVLKKHWPERHWNVFAQVSDSDGEYKRKSGKVRSFVDREKERKKRERHKGVIECERCQVTFNPNRRTRKGYMDKFRCPSCGEKHGESDLKEKQQTKGGKQNSNKQTKTVTKWLYLIGTASDEVKIGISSNPEQRLKGLQTGNPNELELIATTTCSDVCELENGLHNKYNTHRLNGEWFDLPSEKLFTLIEAVKNDNADSLV